MWWIIGKTGGKFFEIFHQIPCPEKGRGYPSGGGILLDRENALTILIADRNPHVRAFMAREMTAAGYRVHLAKNAREVLRWIYQRVPLDLVILDVDLPDASEAALLESLSERIPVLPVVVHAFRNDYTGLAEKLNQAVFVEKSGNSIEPLKKAVAHLLRKSDKT